VISAVRAPFPVRVAFVVMVVPCMMCVTSPRKSATVTPLLCAISAMPLKKPFAGAWGVLGVLKISPCPFSSTRYRSVNVPPTSMPIRYFTRSSFPRCG
jgi:hypothetical protein